MPAAIVSGWHELNFPVCDVRALARALVAAREASGEASILDVLLTTFTALIIEVTAMLRINVLTLAILIALSSATAQASPVLLTQFDSMSVDLTIQTLSGAPESFFDLTQLSPVDVPAAPPDSPGRTFHVGIEPGITDLHISLPAGFVFGNVTQNLFPHHAIREGPSQIAILDLDGGLVPFSTYFVVAFNPPSSFRIEPTVVPEPATLSLMTGGLVGVAVAFRRREH